MDDKLSGTNRKEKLKTHFLQPTINLISLHTITQKVSQNQYKTLECMKLNKEVIKNYG